MLLFHFLAFPPGEITILNFVFITPFLLKTLFELKHNMHTSEMHKSKVCSLINFYKVYTYATTLDQGVEVVNGGGHL